MRLLDANMRNVSDVEVKQGKNKVPNLLPPEVRTKTWLQAGCFFCGLELEA